MDCISEAAVGHGYEPVVHLGWVATDVDKTFACPNVGMDTLLGIATRRYAPMRASVSLAALFDLFPVKVGISHA